jgi:hypothetical protein
LISERNTEWNRESLATETGKVLTSWRSAHKFCVVKNRRINNLVTCIDTKPAFSLFCEIFREALACDKNVCEAFHHARFRENGLNTVGYVAELSLRQQPRVLFLADPRIGIQGDHHRQCFALIYEVNVLNDAPNPLIINQITFADIFSDLAAELSLFEVYEIRTV